MGITQLIKLNKQDIILSSLDYRLLFNWNVVRQSKNLGNKLNKLKWWYNKINKKGIKFVNPKSSNGLNQKLSYLKLVVGS